MTVLRNISFILLAFASCKGQPTSGTSVSEQRSAATTDTTHATPADSSRIIIPGEQLGMLHIGTTDSVLLARYGNPDFSDAAMGKAMLVWYGKQKNSPITELDVYTAYKDSNMREKTVQQIRSTSAYFTTPGNAGVGRKFSAIKSLYPGLAYVHSYKENNTGRNIKVYDDAALGLSVETTLTGNEKICTGIIIHKKGREVILAYINLR